MSVFLRYLKNEELRRSGRTPIDSAPLLAAVVPIAH
jgi:hypothetical protein